MIEIYRVLEQNCSHNKNIFNQILNAIFSVPRSRKRQVSNTAKIKKAVLKNKVETLEDDLSLRDQGFTRAKILIMTPTRSSCYELIQLLRELTPGLDQVGRIFYVFWKIMVI